MALEVLVVPRRGVMVSLGMENTVDRMMALVLFCSIGGISSRLLSKNNNHNHNHHHHKKYKYHNHNHNNNNSYIPSSIFYTNHNHPYSDIYTYSFALHFYLIVVR